MMRNTSILVVVLLAAASVSAYAASGRLGRELLQSGVTCANDIPYCTARRCTTRILGSKETYVCLRCQPTFVPARGIDGRSIVQCVCPAGTALNTASGKCERCAIGSYCPGGNTNAKTKNDNIGGETISCNPENSTASGMTTKSAGASRYTDCVAKGGYVLPDSRGGDAQPCTGPFYAPENNRLRTCLRCQSGLAPPADFQGPNVDRVTVCQVPPGKFWELNVVRDCPMGLYRETYQSTRSKAAISCKSCPDYWTTNRTGSVNITECNTLLPGYQIANTSTSDLALIAQEEPGSWNPAAYDVEQCPVGTYFNASSTDFKCTACPYGSVTREAGALSIDECMVPPGYFIAQKADGTHEMKQCKTSEVEGTMGYYRSGWVSYSQVVDTDENGVNKCTPCGENIMSRATEADENPKAANGSKVAATSASCFIAAGYGISFNPEDFKTFRATPCPANTYGVATETFGLINAPCKACGKNLKSEPLSTSYTDCKNPAGFGYTSEGANQCPPNFWAAANSMAPCEPCPEGRYTDYVIGNGTAQDSIDDCKVPAGSGVYDPEASDPFVPITPSSNKTVKPCPVGFFSVGDAQDATETSNPVCRECPVGQSTTEVGASSCNTCAAGYGNYTTSCEECKYGDYSSMPSQSCSQCPTTVFADPVGAEFTSPGLTFRTGLHGKEACVPRYAQQAAPTGDRLVLPASMFTDDQDLAATGADEAAIQVQVERCVKDCPAGKCCIAQMQLQADNTTLNCKRAELEPAKPFSVDSSNTARMYYKLPPSEMAASSINDKAVAAKTIASGIYAVCNINDWSQAALNGEIGTSFDNTKVEKDSTYIDWGECSSDEQCQELCNAQSTCWGYIVVEGKFALRGGEDSLGGRTFFSSPVGSPSLADVLKTW